MRRFTSPKSLPGGVGQLVGRHATIPARSHPQPASQARIGSGSTSAHSHRTRRRLSVRARALVRPAGRSSQAAGPRSTARVGVEWIAWFALLAVVTALLVRARPHINGTYIALAYLLVVQGGSARRGRPLGLALAAVAFVSFDYFFLPPFGTLTIQDPLNWFVLLAFLLTAVVSAQLLYRAQAEAADARQRAAEIDRLASLGAETLSTARAEDALTAIAAVIRTTLALDQCSVYAADGASTGVRLAAQSGERASAV